MAIYRSSRSPDKFFNFNGRETPGHYWFITLIFCGFNAIIVLGSLGLLDNMGIFVNDETGVSWWDDAGFIWLMNLLFLPGYLAATTRRLHDIGRSGWLVMALLGNLLLCVALAFYAEILTLPLAFNPQNIPPMDSVPGTLLTLAILSAVILQTVLWCLCSIKGKIEHNKYGPPPGHGLEENDLNQEDSPQP